MLEFDLPIELFFKIFGYLNYVDIQSVALVCRHWFEICQKPIIQSKIILTISDINDQDKSPIELFQKSFRSYRNLCLEDSNLDVLNQILQNIGDTVKSVTFKKISFANGSFYKALLNLKNIDELKILNCSFQSETFLITTSENRISVDVILSNVKIFIFKEIECDSWPLLLEIGPKLVKLREFEISEYYYQTGFPIRYNTILSVIRTNSKSLRKLVIKDIDNVSFWSTLIELNVLYDRLERFDCEYVCWEPETAVCDFISNQKNLIHLNLSQSKALRDIDVNFIVDNLNSLKILNLDFCTKLTNHSASYLFNLKNLEDLTIYECPEITGDGLKKGLINITNNKVKKFRISGLEIHDDFIILLSAKLLNLQILEIKYPKTNQITDLSVQAIIDNLVNLKELSLEGCYTITDFGITGFNSLTNCQEGISIKKLKNLEILDLSMCNITDFSIIHGIDFNRLKGFAIPFVPNIKVLAMKSMILNCPHIECLDFQNDTEIDELLEYAIKNLKRLKYININRICSLYKYKNKNQYACVDRSKKEYFINIDCDCRICNNAKDIFINFKNNTI